MGKRFSLRSLLRDRTGSAVHEFAIVAPIFIAMMLITFDLGYMLFCQSVLDGAARDAARMVRTGQAQSAADPQGTFFAALDSNLNGVINPAAVSADVESFPNFSSLQSGLQPLIDPKTGKPVTNFTPGTPNSAVAVRVSYTYNFMVPWVGSLLMSSAGSANSARLQSTVVFKNEPYPTAP